MTKEQDPYKYLVSVNSEEQVSHEGHVNYCAKHLQVTDSTTIGEIFKWVEKIRLRSMHQQVDSIIITIPENQSL